MKKEHVIWTDIYDKKDYLIGDYEDYLVANDITTNDCSFEEWVTDEIDVWFECEHMNLNKELPNTIVAIADLGLWFGRRNGIKVCNNNLNSIFNVLNDDYSDVKFYCDRYNVCATLPHHDGTHYITFRMLKDGVDLDKFKEMVINGKMDSNKLSKYTKSIKPFVSSIYGW